MTRLSLAVCFSVLGILLIASCSEGGGDGANPYGDVDFRQEMRNFVIRISTEAKAVDPDFLIIPQNGEQLIFTGDGESEEVDPAYAAAIDGQGREDFFYGYIDDGIPTPTEDQEWMQIALDAEKGEGIVILVTDYCAELSGSTAQSQADDSRSKNNTAGYLSYQADSRGLETITGLYTVPAPDGDDSDFSEVENFLYLIDPREYTSKGDYIAALDATDYDLFIIDLFFDDGTTTEALTAADVDALKSRPCGGPDRRVICYMSIGEAEDYRFYWDASWVPGGNPVWLEHEDPNWEGNYYVTYWDVGWQDIICDTTNPDSYLKKILDAGFDGVYLDLIDAYEIFEEM